MSARLPVWLENSIFCFTNFGEDRMNLAVVQLFKLTKIEGDRNGIPKRAVRQRRRAR
jgi:hypothetical protein